MAEVEIVPKAHWRNITNITASAGPVPPAGTAIVELDGPHGLTDADGVWVSGIGGISGINQSLEQPITVIDPTTVSLDDATAISGTYTGGGIFRDASQNRHRIQNGQNGPVSSGGGLYFVPVYIPSNERGASEFVESRVYRSTNDGATWSRQDSGNEAHLIGNPKVDARASGSTLWVSYNRGPTLVRVRPFDLATLTWGLESAAGPTCQSTRDSSFPILMADGRVFVFHEHFELSPSTGIDRARPAWSIYNPSTGVWDSQNNYFSHRNNTVSGVVAGSPNVITTSTPHGYQTGVIVQVAGVSGMTGVNISSVINVTGPSTFEQIGSSGSGTYTSGGTTHVNDEMRSNGVCVDAGGRIHLFYGIDHSEAPPYTPAYLFHRSFDAAAAALDGDEQVISSEIQSRYTGYGVPLAFTSGGTQKLAILLAHKIYSGGHNVIDKLQIAEADAAVNPSWSISDVSAANPPTGGEYCWGDSLYDPINDKVWAFWTAFDGSSKTKIVYNSKIVGGSWGADTNWKTDSEYWYADPAPRLIGGEIKVIYTKVHPNEIGTLETMDLEMERFPHIDVVSMCPEGVGDDNYSYFD